MSVLNNFSVSVAKGLRRLRQNKELSERLLPGASTRRHGSKDGNTRLKMDKCLIVSKVTRYEYERHSHDYISDSELETVLRKRGSDFDSMLANHKEQKAFEENVAKRLREMGHQVEMASRYPPMSNIHENQDAQTKEHDVTTANSPTLSTKVLPFLALNEVFIGESVTSRVSLLRLQIDNGQWTHTKSSGLCVTTGTGSTSWHFSINCLRTHSVLELMKILGEEFDVKLETSVERAREVAERYNQKLMFAPDSDQLAYSVREYITFEEWPVPRGLRVRDRAAAVRVRSHCTDAGLVIDGSVSFPFNDGTQAALSVHPEDSLMTVHMDDTLPY
ncbi:UPF0465 protein C5orf33 [Papilio machaon]|uniref:UPF0465 protein C5orf33 n=1 Tax=Papilio machaon TaxID=76193 RepID=A0A194QZL5_PAPMA|nr:UPF0465 protein C5orf33 [Papilio machaon]